MSADPIYTTDDPRLVQGSASQIEDQIYQEAPVAQDALSFQPPAEGSLGEPADWAVQDEPQDQPLNAEEATILVLHFLRRMGKKIITPRRAALNDESIFVVEVDLKGASATVHIHADTREIVEYAITPIQEEVRPLPLPSRRTLIILGAIITIAIAVMYLNFYFYSLIRVYTNNLLENLSSDHLIIGGVVLLVAGGVVWWRRREA